MQKFRSVGRQMLLQARLGAPPLVQKTIITPFMANKELFRSVVQPYLSIYRLTGQNKSGSLTLTYIGAGNSVRVLRNTLFTEDSTVSMVGRLPIWQVENGTVFSGEDIIVIEANKHLIHKLPQQNALLLPPYVHLVLPVGGAFDDIVAGFGKSARDDLRLTRKHGYTYRVSHDQQDFDHFYDNMYRPTMQDRHSKANSSMAKSEAEMYFRKGLLFLVERDGKSVAGGVYYPNKKTVEHILLGILNSDIQLMKEGVGGALNILVMQWANQEGFEHLNFLGAAPFLTAGMFQYKRKWGSQVIIAENEDRRLWLKIRHNTPAVSQFLTDNPLIAADKAGGLRGIIATERPDAVDAKMKTKWDKRFLTPGLDSLHICAISDLIAPPMPVNPQ